MLLAVGLVALACVVAFDRLGTGGRVLLALAGAWGLGAGVLGWRSGGPSAAHAVAGTPPAG